MKGKILTFLIVIMLLFSVVSCSFIGGTEEAPSDNGQSGTVDDEGSTPPSDDSGGSSVDSGLLDAQQQEACYTALWQTNTKTEIKIDISPAELRAIDRAYHTYTSTNSSVALDVYRKCNITIIMNGTTYEFPEAGIRMRGNTSKTLFCDADGLIYNYVHFRINLAETFDSTEYVGTDLYHDWHRDTTDGEAARKLRKDRSFATMEKFYIKWNKNYDQSYTREIYANKVFRDNGIVAPNITLAQYSIKQNGEMQNMGVCTLYEIIDKSFIKRNFPTEKGGDLYKAGWSDAIGANFTSATTYGIETDTDIFNYNLKTNDETDVEKGITASDHSDLINLKRVLNTVNANASDFEPQLEAVIDMDYFIKYEAISALLGNPDDLKNNQNNYYLYFTPSGKAYIIPYDYDRCLGINMNWNPSGDGMTSLDPFSTASAIGGYEIDNPLYTKTFFPSGNTKYQTMFLNEIQSIMDGTSFQYSSFKAVYDAYEGVYANYTQPSASIVSQCSTISSTLFTFSEEGVSPYDYSSTSANVSTEDYITAKRAIVLAAIQRNTKIGATPPADTQLQLGELDTYTVEFDASGINWKQPYIWTTNGTTSGWLPMTYNAVTSHWEGDVPQNYTSFYFYCGVTSSANCKTVNISINEFISEALYTANANGDNECGVTTAIGATPSGTALDYGSDATYNIFLDASVSNWKKVFAWVTNGASSGWLPMTKNQESNLWSCSVPSTYTSLYFYCGFTTGDLVRTTVVNIDSSINGEVYRFTSSDGVIYSIGLTTDYIVYFDNTVSNWDEVHLWTWIGGGGGYDIELSYDATLQLWYCIVPNQQTGMLFYRGTWGNYGKTCNIDVSSTVRNKVYTAVDNGSGESNEHYYDISSQTYADFMAD